MGSCTLSEKRSNRRPYSFECQPTGTDDLKDKSLPRLLFHAILANVKLKKYPYTKATAYFRVREGQNFALASKSTNEQDVVTWKIHETFDFQMTEYELRKQFLQVSIVNEYGTQVATIKINLFLIATGPYRQDFALQFPQAKTGRISFDLKISQIIDLEIKSQEAEILLTKKHPGEQFCFSIKTIHGTSGRSVESDPSYPAVVLLENKSDQNKDIDMNFGKEGLPRRKSKRQLTQEIRQGGELKWYKQGGQLPSISTKVIASELHHTYFQILVWKYQNQSEASMELFVDCYVSFYKLLGTEATTFQLGEKEVQSRSIKIKEKVEHRGKDYGNGVFRFTILNECYFKQYQLCIHSQEGILKANPIFGIQQTTSTDKCPELSQLLNYSNSVQQHFINLNRLQTDQGPRDRILEVREIIENELSAIFQLLEKTSFPSTFLYNYSSERDLLEGQKILVELGVKVTEYIESEDPTANDLCWLILISLIKRSEFNLSFMGFNDKQKKQIINQDIDQLLHFKKEVASMFKIFLYKLLNHALNSIDHKGSEYERTFAQIFTAYAYFRIPEFRKDILRLITKDTDPEIGEWTGADFCLQQDIGETRVPDKGNTFRQMFDWEHHFYKYLKRNPNIENNNITLKQILKKNVWKERFIKRGLAFFYFIKYWVTYVESALPNLQEVQWAYFPGYNRLIRGFFVELKNRPILEYPDGLIEATLKLLVNDKLLNPIMKILIHKVNRYDTSSVIRLVDYISMMLQTVGAHLKCCLPLSFNYNILFKALSLIFEADFAIAVSAALSLLYDNFDIFHLQFRRSLSMYFLGSAFNHFFLHWSYNVRSIFYHLLTFKIYKDALQDDPSSVFQHSSHLENSDILNRYDKLTKMLIAGLKKYRLSKKVNAHPCLDKALFKKMKVKILERKGINYIDKAESCSDKDNLLNKSLDEFRQNMDGQNSMMPLKKLQKCHSEIWTERKVRFEEKRRQGTIQKKEEIKRMSRSNEFSYEHKYNGKRSSLSFQIVAPSEFQIKQLRDHQLKLIEVCLPQFRKVEKVLMDGLEKGFNEAPTIKQEIAIDKRQIRPKEFDQW